MDKEMEEFYEDDRCIIPEEIKRMSLGELDREISHLEADARKDRACTEKYFADERGVIPEKIKQMSRWNLEREKERCEAEKKKDKERIEKEKQLA